MHVEFTQTFFRGCQTARVSTLRMGESNFIRIQTFYTGSRCSNKLFRPMIQIRSGLVWAFCKRAVSNDVKAWTRQRFPLFHFDRLVHCAIGITGTGSEAMPLSAGSLIWLVFSGANAEETGNSSGRQSSGGIRCRWGYVGLLCQVHDWQPETGI